MILLLRTALLVLLLVAPAQAWRGPEIRVMTQNQFLGADLNPLIAAAGTGDPNLLADVLGETLARIGANDFPLRAHALAKQICITQPHVVGLQEVFRFSVDGLSGPPAPMPFIDHLVETMAEIDDQCGNYVVAASVQNVDVAQAVPGFGVIGFTDRDVVLVRDDVGFGATPFSGNVCPPTVSGVPGLAASGCHFQAVVPLPPAFGGSILRGYVGVDVWVDGDPYRVVNTHLEVQRPDGSDFSSVFQALQAAELIGVLDAFPAAPGTKTIVVGDINSSPTDPVIPQPIQPPPFPLPPPFDTTIIPPYTQFVASGYTDPWRWPGGFTCCHPEDLSEKFPRPDERIDVILAKEPIERAHARVLGNGFRGRIDGLWPSDHNSVFGWLRY